MFRSRRRSRAHRRNRCDYQAALTPRLLSFLVLTSTLLCAGQSRAESALLLGLSAGGDFARGGGHDGRLSFRVGVGGDVLFADGLVLKTRLTANHEVDTSLALLIGFAARGLREDVGLPVGVAIGPTASIDLDGALRAGGQLQFVWGLWLSRVLIEADLILRKRYAPVDGNPRVFNLEGLLALTFRVVPWRPMHL